VIPPAPAPAVVPAPVPAPASVPAPAPQIADTETPDWATIRPADTGNEPTEAAFSSEVGDGFDLPAAAVPVPAVTVQPEPVADDEPRGKARRARKSAKVEKIAKPAAPEKAATAARPGRKSMSVAGGRWKVMVLRGGVYTVLGLLLLGGARNIISPREKIDVGAVTSQVQTALGQNGFPAATAEAFSIRFARAYLTYTEATADTRMEELARYSKAASQMKWGLTTDGDKQQKVTAGPFVSTQPELLDKNNAIITVGAQVNDTTWVYLAVPVYADDAGALVVSGPPAFVAAPARATSPGGAAITQSDDALAQSLTTDVLTGFFTAWAASDTTALKRYTTPDATTSALTGLGGSVTLATVNSVEVPRDGGDARPITASINWQSAAIGTYAQSYRVSVAKGTDGRWYVKDIKGGLVSPDGDSAQTDGVTDGDTAAPAASTPPNKAPNKNTTTDGD